MAATHRFPLWRIPDWLPQRIQQRFPQIRIVHLDGFEGLEKEITDAEIFCGFLLKPEYLDRAGLLRWVHVTAAGVDQLCYPEMLASPVVISNASSVMAEPVAEHTMGLIL